MKKLISSALFVFVAACSHNEPAATTPQSANDQTAANDPSIDPTLPSWAPKSCASYHAAVVNFAACTDVDQAVRDRVSSKYDSDNKTWHDMTNATQADLEQVKMACADELASIQAQMTGKCKNVALPAQASR